MWLEDFFGPAYSANPPPHPATDPMQFHFIIITAMEPGQRGSGTLGIL
jgi:hypothetical protein